MRDCDQASILVAQTGVEDAGDEVVRAMIRCGEIEYVMADRPDEAECGDCDHAAFALIEWQGDAGGWYSMQTCDAHLRDVLSLAASSGPHPVSVSVYRD